MDWFEPFACGLLAIILAWNVRDALRTERIQYGHLFGRRLCIEKRRSPVAYLAVVICQCALLVAGIVTVAIDLL
jgi:hypothetical protein